MEQVAGLLHRAAVLATRRPAAVVATAIVLGILATALALRLQPEAGTDTLVGKGSSTYEATQSYRERFGDDAILVLVREPLTDLLLTQDVQRMLGLEGCISGNAPAGAKIPGGPDGPCGRLARDRPVKVVFGPGTFINESVRQLTDAFSRRAGESRERATAAARRAQRQARAQGLSPAAARIRAQQAGQRVSDEFQREVVDLALRYGLTGVPQLNDPAFVSTLVFDASKPAGTPKRRFAYLFPTRDGRPGKAALIQVRLKAGLSDADRREAIGLVRQATAMDEWRLRNGGSYTVTGAPVVVSDLASSISDSILVLLIAAALVMAATLSLVFSSRLRLLPLAIALLTAALTFGALSLVGASLTMASIAVLPVLIGLAVDYAIQLQSRITEERGRHGGRLGAGPAARRAALLGAPTIAVAAAATAAGFSVLALSPVPMVRGFGLLLVLGILIALVCAVCVGIAALVLADRPQAPSRVRRPRAERAGGRRVERAGARALALATRSPGRVLGVALALAVAGWALDGRTRVESDVQKLVPADLTALRDLDALQRSTGVGGEIDVVVRGRDLVTPEVVAWMGSYQQGLLKHYGYSAQRGCGRAALCPAFSLPDLFSTESSRATAASIEGLLDAVPAYFSQSVITGDRTAATLAFGIRLMPLDEQKKVIDEMRSRLDDGRPEGVRAELAGLPVLAAEANARVSSHGRRLLTLVAGLLAVAAVLLLAFRRLDRALVPLVPIVLTTGWSALVLFASRIPLNPMSVTLGALVIAISTEFSVLLSERYRSERAAGRDPAEALVRTYRSTGAAVVASGITAIAGFAVLAVSDIRMLRDFGIVTVVDLTVSLLGVLVVLPAVLLLAERRRLVRVPAPATVPRPEVGEGAPA